MNPADPEAALREALEHGEALQAQLAGIEEQMSYLGAITQEFARARATLEALARAKRGEEVLLPVGGGNFVRAKLADEDRVIGGIGAGLSVEGPVADALRRTEAQLEAAREAGERLQGEAQRVVQQLQALEAHVGQLTG